MNNKLYNPFIQIAGFKSLLIGVSGLIITTFTAFKTGTHFNGLLNIDLAKDSGYWVYLIENCSQWIILSAFFYLAGLILSKSRVRLIDVLGTTLFSRIPLVITPLVRTIPIFQSFAFGSVTMYAIVGIYLVSLIWTIVLLFNAFKVSGNLKSVQLIVSFIACMILSEVLTKIFLYKFI